MFIKLFKSIYFKPALFLMALAMLTMSFTTPNGTVVLKAGTVIPMELVNTITSKTARSGQLVDFRVTSDVKVDGKTALPLKNWLSCLRAAPPAVRNEPTGKQRNI